MDFYIRMWFLPALSYNLVILISLISSISVVFLLIILAISNIITFVLVYHAKNKVKTKYYVVDKIDCSKKNTYEEIQDMNKIDMGSGYPF